MKRHRASGERRTGTRRGDRPRRARCRRPPSPADRADGRARHDVPARPAAGDRIARRRRARARRRRDRAVAGSPSRWSRSRRATPLELVRLAWHSATATPTCRSSATGSASAAIMCWRRWCAGSARSVTPIEAPFDPEPGAHGHEHHHGTATARHAEQRCHRQPSHARRSAPSARARTSSSSRATPRRRDEGRARAAALYRLMAWLSPSYPVGAFSYSSGIEWAVEAGDITDAATLRALARRR